MKFAKIASVLLMLLSMGQPVSAQELALSLTGKDRSTEFTLAELDAMPQESFATSTTWTEGTVTFSGVPLSHILKEAELTGAVLRLVALNDYSVEMPVAEIGETYPIVATRMNGDTMTVRDKGPYWIVYPYDSDVAFQTETTYARSIWQLTTLSVID